MDGKSEQQQLVLAIRNGQALVEAAHCGQLDIVGRILATGTVDVNFQDNHGRTAAYRAARRGHTDVLQFLIKHGADLETVTSSGASPAFVTAQQGEVEAMRLLLAAGTKINVPPAHMHGSPLGMAVSHGHMQMVELLVQAKSDVTLPARTHVTRGPLHICIDNDDPNLLRLLFKGDIPTQLRDDSVKFAATSHSHRCLLEMYELDQVQCEVMLAMGQAALDIVSSACHAHSKQQMPQSQLSPKSEPLTGPVVVTPAQWQQLRTAHQFGQRIGNSNGHAIIMRLCQPIVEALYSLTTNPKPVSPRQLIPRQVSPRQSSPRQHTNHLGLAHSIASLSLGDASVDGHLGEIQIEADHEDDGDEDPVSDNDDVEGYIPGHIRAQQTPLMRMLLDDVMRSRDRVTLIMDNETPGTVTDSVRIRFDEDVRPVSSLCSILIMAEAAACRHAQKQLAALLAAKMHGGILTYAGFGLHIFGPHGFLKLSSVWLRHPIVSRIREIAFKFSKHYVSRYLKCLVGKRVKFSWSDGWYEGVVHSCDYEAQTIKVHFDDGDVLCYYVKGARNRFRII